MLKALLKKIVRISLWMAVLILLTACQPTPENEIVRQKQDNIQQIIENNTGTKSPGGGYAAPEMWQETLELGGDRTMSVVISAPIIIPDASDYPVVRCKPGKFTAEKLLDIIAILTNNSTLYKDTSYGTEPASIYDEIDTRSEIEAAILQLKRALSDPDSNINSIKNTDPERYETAVESIDQQIGMLTEKLGTAPETIERTPLVLDDAVKTNAVNATADMGKARLATLRINATESEDGRNNRFLFLNMGSMNGGSPIEEINEGLRHPPQITLEDALSAAQDAVAMTAGDEFELAQAAVAVYGDMLSPVRAEKYQDEPQYYVFFFTRSVQGVPYTYQSNLLSGISEKQPDLYFPTYPYEYIRVGVDDTGIIEYEWRAPVELGETLSENAPLLPFDEVKDIFEQQIYVEQIWNESTADSVERILYIDRIELGMMRVINPDTTNEYLMIPVWDFFGHYADVYPEGYEDTRQRGVNENNQVIHDEFAQSLLTLNAIDGSVIDRGLGY